MSKQHEHVTIDEVQRYYAALAGGINDKNAGFVRFMLAQFEECEECAAREEYFSRVSAAFAEEISAYQAEFAGASEVAGEALLGGAISIGGASTAKASLQTIIDRAAGLLAVSKDCVAERAAESFERWRAGAQSVFAGFNGGAFAAASRSKAAIDEQLLIEESGQLPDGVIKITVGDEAGFPSVDIDYDDDDLGSNAPGLMILCGADIDSIRLLEFEKNDVLECYSTEATLLDKGTYYCWVAYGDDRCNRDD